MCSELKLVDTVDINSKVLSKFCRQYSEDDFFSILTKNGVLIGRLSGARDHCLPSISFHKQTIPASCYILSLNLNIDIETFFQNLSRHDVFETVLRGDLSALLEVCKKTVFYTISVKLSYPKVIGSHSIIATLNDAGSLDIYGRFVDGCLLMRYQPLVNVTKEGIEHYRHEWNDITYLNPNAKFDELKRRLKIHTPTVFSWSHVVTINNVSFCFLIVGYLNGRIAFWKFNYLKVEDFMNATIECIADVQTDIENMTAMHWRKSSYGGLLFVGNYIGEIIAVPIKTITEDSVQFGNIVNFGSTENIKVEHIDSIINENNLFVYIIKGAYVIIQLFNNEGNLLDSCTFCAGNLNINDIETFEDKLLVLCETGVLKELKITSDNKKIFIYWRHVYLNINWDLKKAYGMFLTKNKVLFGLITDASRMYNIKEEKENFNITIFVNKAKDPIDILMNNSTNSLRNYYDCLEAARISAILNKEIIFDKLPTSKTCDKFSLLQLKTYHYFSKVSELVYDQLESIHSYNIVPSADIYQMIEIKIAVDYMRILLDEWETKKQLNKNQELCLYQLISFLKETVINDSLIKLNLGNNYTNDIFEVIYRSKDFNFENVSSVCMVCDNDIIGATCIKNHYDNRCAVSMIQIINPKYICPFCKRSVSEEVVEFMEIAECPFCDIEMDTILKLKPVLADPLAIDCQADCLPIENLVIS